MLNIELILTLFQFDMKLILGTHSSGCFALRNSYAKKRLASLCN